MWIRSCTVLIKFCLYWFLPFQLLKFFIIFGHNSLHLTLRMSTEIMAADQFSNAAALSCVSFEYLTSCYRHKCSTYQHITRTELLRGPSLSLSKFGRVAKSEASWPWKWLSSADTSLASRKPHLSDQSNCSIGRRLLSEAGGFQTWFGRILMFPSEVTSDKQTSLKENSPITATAFPLNTQLQKNVGYTCFQNLREESGSQHLVIWSGQPVVGPTQFRFRCAKS